MSDVPSLTTGKKCLVLRCTRTEAPALKRGLCVQCHGKANAMVKSGRTTWEKLEAMGLAKPQDDDPFTEAFNDKSQS